MSEGKGEMGKVVKYRALKLVSFLIQVLDLQLNPIRMKP